MADVGWLQVDRMGDLLEVKPEDGKPGDVWSVPTFVVASFD